jgi:hypothetical protein
MSVVCFSVCEVVTDLPVITQERSKRPTPETELFPDYNPLWKNDLSDNWIINGRRQRAEDVGLEKPSESAVN